MAAGRPAGLSTEQIEQLTDLMVMKLARVSVQSRNDPDSANWLNKDERPINRDEVRLVIIDTSILLDSADPTAMLDEWRATA